MKKYRVLIDMIENGYVDVEANNLEEASEKAHEEIENGGFIGINSHAELVETIEQH